MDSNEERVYGKGGLEWQAEVQALASIAAEQAGTLAALLDESAALPQASAARERLAALRHTLDKLCRLSRA